MLHIYSASAVFGNKHDHKDANNNHGFDDNSGQKYNAGKQKKMHDSKQNPKEKMNDDLQNRYLDSSVEHESSEYSSKTYGYNTMEGIKDDGQSILFGLDKNGKSSKYSRSSDNRSSSDEEYEKSNHQYQHDGNMETEEAEGYDGFLSDNTENDPDEKNDAIRNIKDRPINRLDIDKLIRHLIKMFE